jgi:hypothetical protein
VSGRRCSRCACDIPFGRLGVLHVPSLGLTFCGRVCHSAWETKPNQTTAAEWRRRILGHIVELKNEDTRLYHLRHSEWQAAWRASPNKPSDEAYARDNWFCDRASDIRKQLDNLWKLDGLYAKQEKQEQAEREADKAERWRQQQALAEQHRQARIQAERERDARQYRARLEARRAAKKHRKELRKQSDDFSGSAVGNSYPPPWQWSWDHTNFGLKLFSDMKVTPTGPTYPGDNDADWLETVRGRS